MSESGLYVEVNQNFSSMPFNILIITALFPSVPTDGLGNFIFHSAEALLKAGNRVTVLVSRPWTPRIFALLNSEWNRPPLKKGLFDPALNIHVKHHISIPRYFFSGYSGLLYQFGTSRIIKKLVQANDIQVIHSHTEKVVPIINKLGLPIVVTLHGIDTSPRLLNTEKKKKKLRLNLNNADRIILVGEPLWSYYAEVSQRSVHFRVVPNGFFLPEECIDKRPKMQGDVFKIISVSNLQEGKGVDFNLKALFEMNKLGFRKWTYTIVGEGPERSKLKKMVIDLGLKRQVFFRGRLPHDKTLASLKEADIFLLPSYREAFGVAYLEAMAASLLTIGVKGQGPEDFIKNCKTGYLVQSRNMDSICLVLRLIFENRALSARIAAAGQDHIRRKFTWKRHAEKLMAVYTELQLKGVH